MVTLRSIKDARERIRGSIVVTPFVHSEKFSQQTGNSIFLKLENLQMTGAFKERGALNKILLLSDEERRRGVIAASAGNHAQAVAYHATKRGIQAQICMPLTTPLVKVSATRGYGAEVILAGANYDEACEEAVRRSKQFGLTFIHPFDDEAVIAGQGTLGLEMLEQHGDLDALVIPVGGGGLIAGVACAVKETNPKMKVIGVQSSRLASMKAALEKNELVTLPANKTIADGIAVRCAGTLTFPLVQKYVDEIVTVDEEEIASAILQLLEKEKLLAEGAGAAATAALLNRENSESRKKTRCPGQRGKHRRLAPLADHPARTRQGRPPRPPANPFARSSRRAAKARRRDRRPEGQHRRNDVRPRLLRRRAGRRRHRHHHGNARAGARRGLDRRAGCFGLHFRARTIEFSIAGKRSGGAGVSPAVLRFVSRAKNPPARRRRHKTRDLR